MTQLLEQALKAAQNLPQAMQDDLARMMLMFSKVEQFPILLSQEEDEAIARAENSAEKGLFATEEAIAAVWSKPRKSPEA